jgi:hypothetical protein
MNEQRRRSAAREFGVGSFFRRFAASVLLVFLTYNPTEFSYFRWLLNSRADGDLGPPHFIAGIAITIGWTIFVVATQRSLGTVGIVLGAALIGGIVWWVTQSDWFNVDSFAALTWVVLFCLSLLLAVGLSWSHVWRRLTGQLEVDDNDD